MVESNATPGARRKRLYIWAAAIVAMLGAALLAIGEIWAGVVVVIAALLAAIFVWRRSTATGYE